jgi:hypothetical protein
LFSNIIQEYDDYQSINENWEKKSIKFEREINLKLENILGCLRLIGNTLNLNNDLSGKIDENSEIKLKNRKIYKNR